MINIQRVKRIKSFIYTVIVILLFLPLVLLFALTISMIGFLRDAGDSLNRIETYITQPASDSAEPQQPPAEGQSSPGGAPSASPAVITEPDDEELTPNEPHDSTQEGQLEGGAEAIAASSPNRYTPVSYPNLYFSTIPAPAALDDKTLYLTIDNTPSSNFSEIMSLLKKYSVPATFFVWRGDSGGTPQIGSDYRALLQAGHSIGIHSGDKSIPLSSLYISADAFLDDFNMMFEIIEAETGVRTRLYRLPGGSVHPSNSGRNAIISEIKRELDARGFIQHDWNASAQDAVNPPLSMQQILTNLHTSIDRGGRIIALVHDGTGSDSTIRALDQFIPYCLEQGYTFRALSYDTVPVSFIPG